MLPEFMLSQVVFAMACYTGMIFNATLLQIVSLKIVQGDITLRLSLLRFQVLPQDRTHLAEINFGINITLAIR